jgi:hydrogenase nickel incorporation protein HypB
MRVSSGLVVTKVDLLPYLDCDVERMKRDAIVHQPRMAVFTTSAKTGEGLAGFLAWLDTLARMRS